MIFVSPCPGMLATRVARDRQPPGRAAADPPQHQRVRAAPRIVGVGARLLGALRSLVGADDQDRVGRRQHVPAGGERRLRRGRKIALLDLRADDEQHEREQQPGYNRDCNVLPDAPRDRPSAMRPRLAFLTVATVARQAAARNPPRRGDARAGRVAASDKRCKGAVPCVNGTTPVRHKPDTGTLRTAPGCRDLRTSGTAYSDAICRLGAPSASTWAEPNCSRARLTQDSESIIAHSED